MKTFAFKSCEDAAKVFRTTPERIRSQYEKNRAEVATMLEQARKSGRKVNGYTAEELANMVAAYDRVIGQEAVA